ncbi:hypothetical protein [Virgibacillus sp. 7505]|nr:hypothetical protein [Virgibacillus sp. 7505]
MGFNYGTRHLPKQTQEIIKKREENDKILKEEAEKKKEQEQEQKQKD